MTAIAELLTDPELRAIRPPDRLTVSEWADRYRILDPENCSTPGPWSTEVTPYLREIMDAYGDRPTRRITVMCSTQVGKTEALLNCLLYTIAQDPVPCLLTMPTEEDVKSFGARRLRAAIDYCDPVQSRRTGRKADDQAKEQGFDGMTLYYAWSNSPARLAQRSIGRFFGDELDKWPPFAGREADPLSLAEERLRWFPDSKSCRYSTPTTQQGLIWREWCASSREWFHVPCPFCGEFQPLKFARNTVRWPADERDPVRIRRDRLAVYVCQACEREIPDDDDHKRRMQLAGVWCPEGAEVDRRGVVRGAPSIPPEHRGFHVNALNSPVLSWSDVAAKFLESKDDVGRLMNFTNSWLGWPWVEKSGETSVDHVRQRAGWHARGTAPESSVVVTAGVDVQKDLLYYAVRAWAPGERSWLVEADRVEHWEQLEQALVGRAWPVVKPSGDQVGELPLRMLLIDSRYRRAEVLEFCARFPELARPIQGATHQTIPTKAVRMRVATHGRPGVLWTVDVHYYKDKLARLMHADIGARGCWMTHADVTEEFVLQVTAEHKVLVRGGRAKGILREEWVKRPGAGGNHWLDCEVYTVAGADMLGVWRWSDDDPPPAPPGGRGGPRRPPPTDTSAAGATGEERRGAGFIRRPESRGRGGWLRR